MMQYQRLTTVSQNEIIKWEFAIFTSQSKIDTYIVTEVGYNICIISGSWQCILYWGKLVTVLVQITLCKIIIPDFNTYYRLSTWECQDCQEYFARISLKWDMDIGKILFTLSYVKYIKQFAFYLLINGKSIERKVFPSIL